MYIWAAFLKWFECLLPHCVTSVLYFDFSGKSGLERLWRLFVWSATWTLPVRTSCQSPEKQESETDGLELSVALVQIWGNRLNSSIEWYLGVLFSIQGCVCLSFRDKSKLQIIDLHIELSALRNVLFSPPHFNPTNSFLLAPTSPFRYNLVHV